MTAINDNAQLTTIAAEVFRTKGYDEVTAEFSAFHDFKVKWTRSYRWISIEVSDYLQDADEVVVRDLFTTIAEKITGNTTAGYEPSVINWIKTEARTKWDVFVRRNRGHVNEKLEDILSDLKADGWIPEGDGFKVFLSPNCDKASVIFNTALIRDSGDSEREIRRHVFESWVNCSIPFDVRETDRKEEIRRAMVRYDAAN